MSLSPSSTVIRGAKWNVRGAKWNSRGAKWNR
jgi:hypothetical protein